MDGSYSYQAKGAYDGFYQIEKKYQGQSYFPSSPRPQPKTTVYGYIQVGTP